MTGPRRVNDDWPLPWQRCLVRREDRGQNYYGEGVATYRLGKRLWTTEDEFGSPAEFEMTGHDSWQPIPEEDSGKARDFETSFLAEIIENVLRRDRIFESRHHYDPTFVPSLTRTIFEEIRDRFEFKLKGPR